MESELRDASRLSPFAAPRAAALAPGQQPVKPDESQESETNPKFTHHEAVKSQRNREKLADSITNTLNLLLVLVPEALCILGAWAPLM